MGGGGEYKSHQAINSLRSDTCALRLDTISACNIEFLSSASNYKCKRKMSDTGHGCGMIETVPVESCQVPTSSSASSPERRILQAQIRTLKVPVHYFAESRVQYEI